MSVSAGSLNPPFTPAVSSYDVVTPNGTETTSVTATPANASAKLAVNNQTALPGQAFGPIALAVGITPVSVLVDAPGASKSYTIVITRGGPADLFGLELSAGGLAPEFDPALTSYFVSAPSTTADTTVTATLSDPRATMTVNNQPALSGDPFGPVSLATGDNTLTIVVTGVNAETKTYTVRVNRAGPGNADLSVLQVSAGSLSPPFNANTLNYGVTAASTTSTTTVTATVDAAGSTLTINGETAQSAVPFGPIVLNQSGTTALTVTVRSQDGVTVKSYTVTVARGLSSNRNLAALTLSAGPLKPSFSPTRTSYDVKTGASTKSTTVTATTQHPGATVKINGKQAISGQPFGPISLSTKSTAISIEVRAENGKTGNYRVTVKREN